MNKILVLSAAFLVSMTLAFSQDHPARQVSEQDPYRTHLMNMYGNAEMKYAFDKQRPARWKKWQKELRTELSRTLGLDVIEKACEGFKPTASRTDSEDLGWCTRERWMIQTEPDILLPIVIMRPKGLDGRKVPLMITPHGHGKNTESYAGVYHSEKERAQGEEGERNVAVQAAQHGFIAIAPTARGFGKTRNEKDLKDDKTSSCQDLMLRDALVGRTPVGDRVWDIMKIIDWALENLPVDGKNIIVSGNSGGGTATSVTGLTTDSPLIPDAFGVPRVSGHVAPGPLNAAPAGTGVILR